LDFVQYGIKTSFGSLYLVASSIGLCGVYREPQEIRLIKSLRTSGKGFSQHTQILKLAVTELNAYLSGKRKVFTVPLDFEGTTFQKKVWRELEKIPYGQTCSYSEIAQKIKHHKAYRAVGTANAKNPLCIFIPCHRVITADQSLGGYSGGLKMKTQLLKLEGAI
jgi:methylated-DNA-[protein]-cysteine S-methyltransferase